MKTSLKQNIRTVTMVAAFGCAAICQRAGADVLWNGSISSDWSNPVNWTGGLPSAGGAGNAVINSGAPFATPTVSTFGNSTVGQTYVSVGAGLNVTGGSLSTFDLITGIWGNSAAVSVSGGALNISGLLNMGAGGFDGDLNISGGSVSSSALSINTLGGAGMDLSGSGSYTTDISEFGDINYWVLNDAITAYGGAPGWAVNIDTTTLSGSVILTAVAVPEPSTFALAGFGVAALIVLRRRR